MQGTLFGDLPDRAVHKSTIKTEGIKYAGSKRTIIPFILRTIAPLGVKSVFDAFSGSTRVSQALSQHGYTVIANDCAHWSETFGRCYLQNRKPHSYFAPMIEHLNALPGVDGWFTANYGGNPNDGCSIQADGKKKVWQIHNTRKLDAIREEIDRISDDPIDRSVLLTSLIIAMDKVDSTLGHHVSYLKDWAARAYNTMQMEVPRIRPQVEHEHVVHRSNALDLVGDVTADLAYYDPPYGSSNDRMPPSRVRYASYYHLWTTICLNDRPPITGSANRREDVADKKAGSIFEDFRRGSSGRFVVIEAIEKLIAATRCQYIVLSYSNQGRATRGELLTMIHDLKFNCETTEIDYRSHVMRTMRWTNEWVDEKQDATKEFLFVLSRR